MTIQLKVKNLCSPHFTKQSSGPDWSLGWNDSRPRSVYLTFLLYTITWQMINNSNVVKTSHWKPQILICNWCLCHEFIIFPIMTVACWISFQKSTWRNTSIRFWSSWRCYVFNGTLKEISGKNCVFITNLFINSVFSVFHLFHLLLHWLQVNIACAHCSHKHKEMHFFTRVLTAKMPILFHTKDLGAHTQGEKTCEMIHSIQPRVQDDKFCFTRTQHLCHRLLDRWQHFPLLKTKGHANTHVTAVTKTISYTHTCVF